MPQSLAGVYLHAIFSTKHRNPYLADRAIREEVHAFLGGVSKRLDCPPLAIGGVEDHVHVLVRFARTLSIMEWIKEVKRVSSVFAKERTPDFSWQGGYAVFSVSGEATDRVIAYIRGQEEHHRKFGFQDELRQLMSEHGIEWDERYVWD